MSRPVRASPPPVAHDAVELRVAFFSDSLSERNGTGAYYHDLVPHLASRVGDVRVLQPRPRDGARRLSMPLPGDPTQELVLPDLFRVRREMAQLRPHIVVTVTPGPFGLLGLWTARRRGCGFISAFHTQFEGLADLYWGPIRGRLVVGALNAVNRFICRRSGTVLVNNTELTGTVRRLGAPKADIMGTPLPVSFLETPIRPASRTLEQVCFAGRLAAEKNVDAVIDAARRHPDLRFVIGGDGPMRSIVEAAAAELGNLDYRGWLDRESLRELIDGSDLLVLPSHMETFGSVALEALARSRPALVAENAGIHDWPQVASAVHALRADETLAEAIGRLRALPPGVLQDSGKAGREGALRLNEQTVGQWLEVLSAHARGLA